MRSLLLLLLLPLGGCHLTLSFTPTDRDAGALADSARSGGQVLMAGTAAAPADGPGSPSDGEGAPDGFAPTDAPPVDSIISADAAGPSDATADVIVLPEDGATLDGCCASTQCCSGCTPRPLFTLCTAAGGYPGQCDAAGACNECIAEAGQCIPATSTPCCGTLVCAASPLGPYDACQAL